MPKAYVISEVAVLDEAQATRYRELAAASVAAYGGRYLARGAAIDFYRRLGFEAVGETMPLRPGSDALQQRMRLTL